MLRNSLALTLERSGAVHEAKVGFQKAVELDPNYAKAHCNLARLEKQLGDLAAAEQSYERAIDADSNIVAAHYGLACIWLMRGEFDRAWPKYRMRWNGEPLQNEAQEPQVPSWDGSPLPGKTLALQAGRSFGKALMFVRFARQLKKLCGAVVLQCAPALASLLARCDGIDAVTAPDDSSNRHADARADLEVVPALLNTSVTTIPNEVPYLFADSKRVDEWRNRLGGLKGLRVGVAWPNAESNGDINSWFDSRLFERLTAIPGVKS